MEVAVGAWLMVGQRAVVWPWAWALWIICVGGDVVVAALVEAGWLLLWAFCCCWGVCGCCWGCCCCCCCSRGTLITGLGLDLSTERGRFEFCEKTFNILCINILARASNNARIVLLYAWGAQGR